MNKAVFTIVAAIAVAVCMLQRASTNAAAEPLPAVEPEYVVHMKVTAYTSSPDETDSTPTITAMGTRTHHGIVATNILPFKTRIKIPALFGDTVFTVEDRMNRRMKNAIDIWMPTKRQAIRFGANYADVIVLTE